MFGNMNASVLIINHLVLILLQHCRDSLFERFYTYKSKSVAWKLIKKKDAMYVLRLSTDLKWGMQKEWKKTKTKQKTPPFPAFPFLSSRGQK